jgi:putative flippase GtrA
VKFNLAAGAISILGNVAVMALLVGRFHVNFLLGNALSIAACSIGNFFASDRLVFRDSH